jgi:hypothetical protein
MPDPTPQPNPPTNPPTYRRPTHEHGLLRTGGKPGNRGGGRPPSAIKAACRRSFAEALDVATKIAKGQPLTEKGAPPTHADTIRAFNVLGRYGFHETETILPDLLVQALAKALADNVPPEVLPRTVEALVQNLKTPDP